MRYSVVILLASLLLVGCASTQRGASVSPRDIQPGSTYEVEIYVLASGDTIARICRKFQIRVPDFEALNPDFDPSQAAVGQSVKIYQRLKH